MEQAVMYVPDVARYLGLTETSVRTHVYRKNWSAVPPPMRLGGRIGWRKEDIDNFLEQKAQLEYTTRKAKTSKEGKGRPRKKRS